MSTTTAAADTGASGGAGSGDGEDSGRERGGLRAGVVLRPLGAPLTLGLSGLGIASIVQSGLGLGWFPPRDASEVGLMMLAVPFLLQLLACIFSYLARDGAMGAAIGVLSSTWLAVGLVHLAVGSSTEDAALGVLLLASAGALCASGGTVARGNPLAGGIFLLSAARFALEGVYLCGGAGAWRHASALLGLVLAGIVLYALVAFELEGQERRPLLPTFRRAQGRLAVSGDARAQLAGIEHEAGVRRFG